jgi:hypothetical protein
MTIKRSLTSLQIAQFLAGFIWGYCYIFLKYDVPLEHPKVIAASGSISGLQTPSLRSRMDYSFPTIRGPDDLSSGGAISCLSDSGEAFTILLTTVYVLPLLLLFVRFFIKVLHKGEKDVF